MLSWVIRLILTSFILYLAVPGSSLFSWHPTCMSLGYGLIMFEGIRVFSSSLYNTVEKSSKVTTHWILQVTSILLAAIGFGSIFYNKILQNKHHFVTWHSIFGLVTLIFTLAVSGGGVMAKYSVQLKKFAKPLAIKSIHAFFALFTFLLGSVSVFTGMNSNWYLRATSKYHPIFKIITIIPVILSILVLLQVISSYLPRLRGTIKNGNSK